MADLLDGLVEGLASNEVWDVIIVLLLGTLLLLHALVALGQLAQGGKGVWAELVEDAWDELGELLVLTGTVDGEGVGWDGGVDYVMLDPLLYLHMCFPISGLSTAMFREARPEGW